jgi:hypothetical protein
LLACGWQCAAVHVSNVELRTPSARAKMATLKEKSKVVVSNTGYLRLKHEPT